MAASEKNLGSEHMPKGTNRTKNKKKQMRTTSGTPLMTQQSGKKK